MTDPAVVRELFLEPRAAYTLAEVAAMLSMSGETVRAWVEAGELEPDGESGPVTVPWSELVGFAMGFWEQEEVEAALGVDLALAIPELLRLADLSVRIPRMEVVALERVAVRDGVSTAKLLSRELLDFVSVHADWLSQEVPGFREALRWPAGA